ncbi:unnamed protein product [Microthlaspi erraticum]|uniref:Retrotransposon gag domain-containing protein n=1 Tax=Microthlaspi erraticum TaxID=1685480 RepID=A0A6D2IBY0_9BRAS|nr:unnamed protein product [Microthlaspi erraticum]
MRCENTIRAKQLAADAHKLFLAEQFPTGPTVAVEPERNRPLSAGFMYRNRPTVDPGNKRSASAKFSRPFADLADQIARPQQQSIGQNFLGQAPNRAVRLAEERMFRARPNLVRPSEVSAKVQNRRPITQVTTRETLPAVGHATPRPRTTKRASRETPRGRATHLAYHGRCIRPTGKLRPASGRDFIGQVHPSDHAADHASVRPRPLPIVRPIVPHDRPNAAEAESRLDAAEVARAQEEGRDPPPPPPNPAGDVNAQPQAGAPTIGDYDSADAFFMDRNPIHPPPPARNDYEIKPQIIALVRQNQFNGLPAEHPLDHIENFEEICSTTRSNGVSADYLKCKLFSFSLGDKASRWLKSLPAHSITTWDEYKAAFINHFYTKQRSISVRNKISTFAKATMSLSMRR